MVTDDPFVATGSCVDLSPRLISGPKGGKNKRRKGGQRRDRQAEL